MRKDVEGAKVYGICLGRLEFQVKNALERLKKDPVLYDRQRGFALESYNTDDMDEIVDLLEIYDVPDRKRETIMKKLAEVAYSASLLVGATVEFGFCEAGFLCLYLKVDVVSSLEFIGLEVK